VRTVIALPPELAVKVTQDDIAHGKARDCAACPVALAAHRAVLRCIDAGGDPIALAREARDYDVHVSPGQADVLSGGCVIARYALPGDAREFIRRFDQFEAVIPFGFTASRFGECEVSA